MTRKDTYNPALEELAARCRQIYIAERNHFERSIGNTAGYKNPGPTWDGGVSSTGRTNKAIWPKIALFMLEHGLDPAVCIALRFQAAQRAGKGSPPMPNQIALASHLPLYTSSAASTVDTAAFEIALRTERELCCSRLMYLQKYVGLSSEAARKFVIYDTSLQLSPLFRYCLAVAVGIADAADEFKEAAAGQFLLAPDGYAKAWKSVLPPKFATEARSWYTQAVRSKRADTKS